MDWVGYPTTGSRDDVAGFVMTCWASGRPALAVDYDSPRKQWNL